MYLVESFKYDKYRVECICRLVKYYCVKENLEVAIAYYSLIKEHYETKFLHHDLSNYLFANRGDFDFYLPYYMIIVFDRKRIYDSVIKMYEIIFTKKFLNVNEWYINNLFNNIQFAIDYLPDDINFFQSMLNYIVLLRERNVCLNNQNNKIVDLIINSNNKYKNLITSFTKNTLEKKVSDKITVMFTITTCKRYDLFIQTINSMKKMWKDLDKVDYFFCVDDNSSEADRVDMQDKYPFFDYYMKSENEKGHRESMNIIWNKLNEIKPTYWIHMEDDWYYFKSNNFVTRGIELLEKYKDQNIHQLVFNRNYGLTMSDMNRTGGIILEPGILLHEKKENVMGKNCSYWPHYSLQPSIVRTSVILELGNYDSVNSFFERDYADKYFAQGYKTMFFDFIHSIHIGKGSGENAYALNNIKQFNR